MIMNKVSTFRDLKPISYLNTLTHFVVLDYTMCVMFSPVLVWWAGQRTGSGGTQYCTDGPQNGQAEELFWPRHPAQCYMVKWQTWCCCNRRFHLQHSYDSCINSQSVCWIPLNQLNGHGDLELQTWTLWLQTGSSHRRDSGTCWYLGPIRCHWGWCWRKHGGTSLHHRCLNKSRFCQFPQRRRHVVCLEIKSDYFMILLNL